MAINYLTQQSYNPYTNYSSTPKPTPSIVKTAYAAEPVAIGPVPTPYPPSGVQYTPQYPGSQTFTTPNPVPYTSTPQGQQELQAMQNSTNTQPTSPVTNQQSFNTDNLMEEYKRRGWTDENAIRADISKEGYKNWYSSPTSLTSTYNIRGTNVTASNPSEAIKSIFPNTDYDKFAAEFNFDPSAFYSSIENEANSQYNFLDQQECALRQAQTDFQNLIQKDYETNFQKGATSKAIAESKLGESKVQAEQQKQNALNAAKQLYNQLSQGYQQRFGGTSGASEAARAILGQEQQRQGGKIQQDYGNTNRQIQQQQFELDTKYNDLVKELDLAKQKANYDALQNFQTNLASVNNNRMMTTQQKEQAKREILLQLRSDQNQIAATNLQFAQNLALMREEAKLQLQNTSSTIGKLADTASQSGSNAANSFANRYQNITSSLSPSGTTNYSVQNTPITYENAVGQFSPAKAPSAEDLWKLGL